VAATAEHRSRLEYVRELLFEDKPNEALLAVTRLLVEDPAPRDKVEALTLRLICLINLGRTAEFTVGLDEALEASRTAPDAGQRGELHALAAIVAHGSGSLDRCVRHLVWAARALNAVELTNPTIAWAWHNLAMAYSYTGFHNWANSAIEKARRIGADLGMTTEFGAPTIRLRHAVDLDQRGDTDGCHRILRDLIVELERKQRDGTLEKVRPISKAVYGYAITRLGALGARWPVSEIDPRPLLFEAGGDSTRHQDLRTLSVVCIAIAERRPIEAVARLETAKVSPATLGPAEVHRLRSLAHLATGDHASAYGAERQAFRVASQSVETLRDLFVDGMAASLDREDLQRRVTHYAGEASTDPLTGLPNRRALEQYVTDLVAGGQPAVLGVCDLDGFKSVNTVHGHLSGDLVLQRIAGVLNRVMRRGDFVARYGGDEFVVVLPTASLAEAQEITRRIKQNVASEDWQSLVPGTPVGVTLGWAPVSGEGAYDTVAEAFEAADHEMLRAKARPRAS
jgi:diguanylate cyclase (GGDEF)-like protein